MPAVVAAAYRWRRQHKRLQYSARHTPSRTLRHWIIPCSPWQCNRRSRNTSVTHTSGQVLSDYYRTRTVTRVTRSSIIQLYLATMRALNRTLILLVCLLPAIDAKAQSSVPDASAVFLPAWNGLPDRAGWRMLVSPAFPGTWPLPSGRGTLVRYSFAIRLNPAVSDAAEMTAPWARSTLELERRGGRGTAVGPPAAARVARRATTGQRRDRPDRP